MDGVKLAAEMLGVLCLFPVPEAMKEATRLASPWPPFPREGEAPCALRRRLAFLRLEPASGRERFEYVPTPRV